MTLVWEALKGLKSLRRLDLGNTEITDAGLKVVKELKGLRELDLQATKVTDAGAKELTGLKNLKLLNVFATKVTDAGAAELERASPIAPSRTERTAATATRLASPST